VRVPSVRAALQAHGPLSRGAFAVAVLVSLAVLFAPADEVPFAPPGVDKIVHGALFAALADVVGVLLGLALWELLDRRRGTAR
jgi:hypothetical protein